MRSNEDPMQPKTNKINKCIKKEKKDEVQQRVERDEGAIAECVGRASLRGDPEAGWALERVGATGSPGGEHSRWKGNTDGGGTVRFAARSAGLPHSCGSCLVMHHHQASLRGSP